MKLIFIYGPPAAGKLTVATALAKQTGYPLLDNHKVLDYLVEVFPRSEAKFDPVRSRLGRTIRLEIYATAASSGVSLITTFAPLSPGMHDFMRQVQSRVEAAGGQVRFVQLLPDRQAITARVGDASRKNRKIDNMALWLEVAGGNPKVFEPFPDVEHLTIDNSHLSPGEVADLIANSL